MSFLICWIPLTASPSAFAEASSDNNDKITIPRCFASLPLSEAVAGIFSVHWSCEDDFVWDVAAGTASLGYHRWTPFLSGLLGIRYPKQNVRSSLSSSQRNSIPFSRWGVGAHVRAILLPDSAFRGLESTDARFPTWLKSPSIQQWILLSNSEISLNLNWNTNPQETHFFSAYGLELWQQIPPSWRTLGALQDTRNVESQGLVLSARFELGAFSGHLGFGRMSVAVDQVTATFFYPAIEISYHFLTNDRTSIADTAGNQ